MPAFICTTCGTQYPETAQPPAGCTICQEERQYVNALGQSWTTLAAMRRTHFNAFRQHEHGLIGIATTPAFAIAQRALLLRSDAGNILWDCISFIDDATEEIVRALGGIAAIAISHPHYYSSMVEWSHAFGNAPIWLHAADRQWVMRPDPAVTFWEDETRELAPGITLIRCGGHFPGGTVLHWARDGRGIVCSGDILSVTSDRKFVSFMRSYPNFIPLSAREVEGIAAALAPFSYDAIYGHYFDRVIPAGAQAVMRVSVARYLRAIAGEPR